MEKVKIMKLTNNELDNKEHNEELERHWCAANNSNVNFAKKFRDSKPGRRFGGFDKRNDES